MKLNIRQIIDVGHSFLYPVFWCLAIITSSGDLGSFENTQYLIHWSLSWFAVPSPGAISLINLYVRKIGHVFSYGLLYFLWFQAFHGDLGTPRKFACLYSLALCLGLAVTDEIGQSFYSSRGPSPWDVALDVSGAGLAAVLTLAFWVPKTHRMVQRPSKTRLL